jgi:hypothetical protein
MPKHWRAAKYAPRPLARIGTTQKDGGAKMGGKSWSHKRAVQLRKLRRKQRTRKAQEKASVRKAKPKKQKFNLAESQIVA